MNLLDFLGARLLSTFFVLFPLVFGTWIVLPTSLKDVTLPSRSSNGNVGYGSSIFIAGTSNATTPAALGVPQHHLLC